jgi:hypothetical protein
MISGKKVLLQCVQPHSNLLFDVHAFPFFGGHEAQVEVILLHVNRQQVIL